MLQWHPLLLRRVRLLRRAAVRVRVHVRRRVLCMRRRVLVVSVLVAGQLPSACRPSRLSPRLVARLG